MFILYSKATLCKAGEARHCIPFHSGGHSFIRSFLALQAGLEFNCLLLFSSFSSLVNSPDGAIYPAYRLWRS